MRFRAVERIDPRALYGRTWGELERHEQLDMIGYEQLRQHEESPREE